MPCYTKETRGGPLFLCGHLGPHCHAAGCRWVSEFLCDYPVGDGKTCDAKLCEEHAHQMAPNVHYCPKHHLLWLVEGRPGAQRELFPASLLK